MLAGKTNPQRTTQALRRGSLTVEMILVVVVLAIVTVGIGQFGVFFANAQELSLAARDGALEASQLAALPAAGAVPPDVIEVIEHQLLSSEIQWSHIRLEHNVTPDASVVVLNSDTGGGFTVNPKVVLPTAPYPGTRYVRLTVTAPVAELYPRALSYFGAQLFAANKGYEHTAVFRYEIGLP